MQIIKLYKALVRGSKDFYLFVLKKNSQLVLSLISLFLQLLITTIITPEEATIELQNMKSIDKPMILYNIII